jgi:hypothetical protein
MTDKPPHPHLESPLPPDPMLGAVLSLHPGNRLIPLFTAALMGAPIAGLLVLAAAQTDAWWSMPVTVGGVALTALGLGWYVLHHWNREVVLYQRGFSFREGSQVVYFSYDEVKWLGISARRMAYLGGLFRRDRYRIAVVTWAGDRITITSLYQRAALLASRLTAQVDRPLRARVEAMWARGEAVGFSEALALSTQGIAWTNEDGVTQHLPWDDYGGYALGGGALMVQRRDGVAFARIPLDALYNPVLLIDLLKGYKPQHD